jgi:hypothetical protein
MTASRVSLLPVHRHDDLRSLASFLDQQVELEQPDASSTADGGSACRIFGAAHLDADVPRAPHDVHGPHLHGPHLHEPHGTHGPSGRQDSSVLPDPPGLALHVKITHDHPATELMGFDAPPDWWCLGVVASGWASTLLPERGPVARSSGLDRRRVRVVHAVSRAGDAVHVIREAGCEPLIDSVPARAATPESSGLLDDCLRRALGLDTAAAPESTVELFALLWIDQLVAAASAGALDRARWADLVALHTAGLMAASEGDPALDQWVVDHLPRAGVLVAEGRPWPRLREETIRGSTTIGIGPELAAWMDDGMFARAILGNLPPLDETLIDLGALLPAACHRRVVETIDAWGLLDG